jgi:hypothetical protein
MRNASLTLLILVIVAVGFYALTRRNIRVIQPLVVAIPTQVEPSDSTNSWKRLLQGGVGEWSTPLPTVAIPVPTLCGTYFRGV